MNKSQWKSFALFAVLILFIVLSITGCSSTAGEGNTQIKLAHFFPATHPVETQLIEPWATAISEATQGRVQITSYPGQTLIGANDIYDGVVSGIAEMGLSSFSYTRGRFPLLEAFELPGIVYNNSKVASLVAWEGIKQLNPAEVQDTELMMVFATGPGDIYSKVPIRTLSDLQGLPIRATGLSAKTLQALGASPDAMAQSEAYEALSRGVVQGNMGPIEVLQGWNQAEVTSYLTLTPFLYNNLFFITMNKGTWQKLSLEDQAAILAVNEEFFTEVAIGLWDQQNESAYQYALEKDMEVIKLDATETAKWLELVEPIQNEFLSNMGQAGLDGQSALGIVKQLANQFNQEYK